MWLFLATYVPDQRLGSAIGWRRWPCDEKVLSSCSEIGFISKAMLKVLRPSSFPLGLIKMSLVICSCSIVHRSFNLF